MLYLILIRFILVSLLEMLCGHYFDEKALRMRIATRRLRIAYLFISRFSELAETMTSWPGAFSVAVSLREVESPRYFNKTMTLPERTLYRAAFHMVNSDDKVYLLDLSC